MRAVVNTAPGQLEFQGGWPLPQPGRGQVRVRTGACAICATDLKMIAGWERTGFPSIPGHEWAGTVDAVGEDVDAAWVGRRCVGENVLPQGGEVGFEYPGGYGEYLVTEASMLQALPADMDLAAAALIEPLAVSVRAVRRLRAAGASALILGDGPIGLLILALLRRAGVEDVVVVGGRASRLALAQAWGAAATYNYHTFGASLAAGVRQACGRAFANVIEASGTQAAIQAAPELVAPQGRVLAVGAYEGIRTDFDWNLLLHQEMEVIGSCASAGAWPEAVELAAAGQIPVAQLVTHRIPAREFARGVALAAGHDRDVIKVVLEW